MKSTILFTPTNEQLVEIAKEHPELNAQIKSDVLTELKKSAVKFTQSRLQNKTNSIYENLYSSVEKNLFVSEDSWNRKPAAFSKELEKEFTQKIEQKLSEELNNEFENLFNSSEFKELIKTRVKERMLNLVLKNLDNQIQDEAKKLTA